MLTAIRFTLLTFILCGLVYPLLLTGMAQVLFPEQANGSLLKNNKDQIIGSTLIGQAFTKPEYFHPRPAANNYDAANSGGYNQGATNQKLLDRINKDAKAYRALNQSAAPIDAVTASASGLDPHISLENALVQSARVAQVRKLDVQSVKKLIQQNSEDSILGDGPYVNVFNLNLALDKQ